MQLFSLQTTNGKKKQQNKSMAVLWSNDKHKIVKVGKSNKFLIP